MMKQKTRKAKKEAAAPASRKLMDYAFYLIVVIWLATFCRETIARTTVLFGNFTHAIQNSDDRNREILYGEFYRFLEVCSDQIPPNATVFLVTDDLYFYYFGSYYLYPRRLLVSYPDSRVDGLVGFSPFWPTNDFLKNNGISHVLEANRSGYFQLIRTD